MQQVKIFNGEEGRTQELEREINAWLKESKARVVQIFGNMSPNSVMYAPKERPLPGAEQGATRRFAASDVFIVVLYEPAA